MRRATLPLVVAAGLLAACDRGPDPAAERAQVARALQGILTYPGSNVVSLSAGDEAAQLVLSSPDSVAQVAAWYRATLALNGWEVTHDGRDGSGVSIYAQKGPRPLWITLRPSTGGPGTSYTLVGAFGADSAAKDSIGK